MRDHQQLARRSQLLIDLQQPAKIGVVKGGLDLVQDVEGAGPRDEERDQKTDRHQRAFATGQQRKPLDLLAWRTGLDVYPRGQPVARFSQDQPTFAAWEEAREDALECRRDVGIRVREDLLHPVSDLDDDVEEVPARLPQVLELLGEELVSLLEGAELLQSQRVDPA